jgi:TRAP-type mannitol/chloroaromatic compound transport system permease large subunit
LRDPAALGIAAQLFNAMHMWTRWPHGGLAVVTVIMCVIFAASSGVIGATETVAGLLAIPAMMTRAYSHQLIPDTIFAGGSLGNIIPPSLVVVIMGPIANVSIGGLMTGMVFRGLIMAALYVVDILGLCVVNPAAGPVSPPDPDEPPLAAKLWITARALVPPIIMVIAVLGSIIMGRPDRGRRHRCGGLGARARCELLDSGFPCRLIRDSLSLRQIWGLRWASHILSSFEIGWWPSSRKVILIARRRHGSWCR